jgi:hypothetical protein
MSLWSFQGARELEGPPAENIAVTASRPPKMAVSRPHRSLKAQQRTGGISHRSEVSACFDEVNIDLGEL